MTFTFGQACEAVGVARGRVEMWIARGKFAPSQDTNQGVAREWTARDALRLAVAIAIADAREAGKFEAFLDVALDNFKAGAGQFLVAHRAGKMGWSADVVTGDKLGDLLAKKPGGAVVISLDATLGPVRQRLAAKL